jgi:molybdopterin-guanine dinucleotide biosynthesis protein A
MSSVQNARMRMKKNTQRTQQEGGVPTEPSCELCILAGGRSARMGHDKARLRLGGVSLLTRLKHTAGEVHLPARVIRSDLVPRCGPLGGIFTGLNVTCAETVLFLSCDMPFVTSALLAELVHQAARRQRCVFVEQSGLVGFPFLLFRSSLAVVERQISRKEFSLHQLARACEAKTICLPQRRRHELLNVNTQADWRRALDWWKQRKY